jgi:hypothetical protein
VDCGAQKNRGNPALVPPTRSELKIFIENLESANDAKYKDFHTIASEADITALNLRAFLEKPSSNSVSKSQTVHALQQWWLKRKGGVELAKHVPNESIWPHFGRFE